MGWKRAAVVWVGAVVLAWSGRSALAQGGPPPANVMVDAARIETVEQRRDVTGEVRAVRRSVLAAEADGRVLTMLVEAGDEVEAGQVIAELDRRRAELELAAAEASLLSAQGVLGERLAEREWLRRDLERVRAMDAMGSTNPTQLDRAETNLAEEEALVKQAEGGVALAEANVGLARVRLEDKTVRAPFRGRVVSKRTEVGQWVSEGDEVVEIVSLDELDAWIEVPEQLVSYLPEAGQALPVVVPGAGRAPLAAELVSVVPVGDELSRVFEVRLRLNAAGRRVLPRMSLTASVPSGVRTESLTIHKDALLRDDAGEFVYAAVPLGGGGPPGGGGEGAGGPTHQAVPVRVATLFAVGDRVVVRAERLAPGTPLLIEGNERVFPTQPLMLLNAGSPAGGVEAARVEGSVGEGS